MLLQADVWQEMLLAAIGEQFIDCVEQGARIIACNSGIMNYVYLPLTGDSVCGVSVRIRNTDDVIQIWNDDSSLAEKSTVR